MSQFQPPSPAFTRGMAPRTGDSTGSRTPPPSRRRRDRGGLLKLKKGGSADDGKKSLLEAIFSKKKSGPPSCSPTSDRRATPTPNPAAVARGVEILQSIFPKWESETLQVVLEVNGFIMEDTIAAVLNMEQAEDSTPQAADGETPSDAGDRNNGSWPVKNPLPEDFLRLPDDDGEGVVKDAPSEEGLAEEEDEECVESEKEEECELEDKTEAVTITEDENRSDRSNSTLAEDDGTLYGKEFDDDSASTDEVITPVLDDAAMRANQKIVADSMNQKFLPVELRNERSSIFDIAHIDVIKKSKLDLSEAEKRIRHREPHLVFELLSKASEIYRSGVISSQELDYLRSMILSRIQPTKMLMDMTMIMNDMISDHEWHLLILKAKGIRHALCIRIFREESKPARNSGHMEYIVRVVDVESGVVWFTRKRFRELYKLYRKLSRLSGQVNECVFPTRRGHGRNSPNQLAYDRAPVLENFLRITAALVAPSPLTFLHGVALKQLQQFLEVPHVGILERNRTQPISRELRVFVYHTVNDLTSPEGKACQKFLTKMKQNGFNSGKNVLDEIGDILDGVQEYMLEHRFEEMELIVQRLMKQILAGNPALGRHSSFVSLMTTDAVSNQDKLQQLLSDAIRHELEDRICVPLMYDLTQNLRRHVQHEERQFRQRVFQLKGKPQSYFGIPMDKISLSSWRSVVDVIKEVDGAFLPLDKMRKLVATAHQIHALYKAERIMYLSEPPHHRRRNSTPMAGAFWQPQSSPSPMNRMLSPTNSSSNRSSRGMTVGDEGEAPAEINAGEQEQKDGKDATESEASTKTQEEDVLSGDDFLPIFIYVIVHSDLEAPILTQVLLNRLCDPEKRRSESGYYLATFEAALHHILSLELPGAKTDGLGEELIVKQRHFESAATPVRPAQSVRQHRRLRRGAGGTGDCSALGTKFSPASGVLLAAQRNVASAASLNLREMFGMDPVLSGSLCFLVLAIAMYLKFIREQPWGDEELSDHKNSPVDGEDDTMPFLHPASPAGRLQAQQQKRGPGQGRLQIKQKQQTQTQQQPLQPHHGYAGFKQSRQTASSAVAAAGVDATAASGANYLPKKQPMRRRTHSATATSTASPSNKVKSAAADGGELGVAMDQLPTTIYEGANYDQFRQQRQPQDSGRNQHRITFDDYDEEMGFLSPPRHADAANDSLESVAFEAEIDGFYDLENHLPEDHLLHIADTPERGLQPLRIGGQYRGGDLLESPDMAEASPDAKTLKTNIERQFVRDVAPPAQMQLEVARKARIPLFLHSPMYVKTSATPLVDEVDAEFTAEFAAEEPHAEQGAGNGEAQALAAAGVGGGGSADATGNYTRRRRPKLSKAKNDSLHVDFKELQIDEMIGQGAFGTVHRAKWRGTAVAVKILVCQYLTADILEEFEAEVQIMSILRHPNICLLMGACLEPPTRCLVIEYLPRGSLWNVLRQDVVIDMGKQYGFARDTALGMNYLHSFQPPILHRDLKSPNLLIDSSYALKISDFGLARVRAHFQTMTGNCGTTQWMAPEVLAAEKYTEKADVFSYGVVVWETVTRQCPYEGLTQIQAALGVLNNNLRPTVPENCPPLFKKLMTLCWVSAPEQRPSFETVLEILNSSTDGSLPPQLERKPSDSPMR